MTTLDERIEAAAKARRGPGGLVSWEDLDEKAKAAAIATARRYLTAAFPELFTDPPTMWLAPWDCDRDMIKATVGQSWRLVDFAAMRDSWLSRNPPTPKAAP